MLVGKAILLCRRFRKTRGLRAELGLGSGPVGAGPGHYEGSAPGSTRGALWWQAKHSGPASG